jgi:opacity protein-like surface antigen
VFDKIESGDFMKKLGWLLSVSALSLALHAQDVVINPPLSVDPEDGKSLKEDRPVGTLVPAKVEINPVDGQLKLEDKKPEDAKKVVEENKPSPKEEAVKEPEAAVISSPVVERSYPIEKYLQFSYGYLDSKWSKADPSLDNGSTLVDFRFVADMNQHNQFGFAIEMIHDNSGQAIPENIRALQYKLFLDYHRTLFTDKLDWMVGLALSVGDFSIKKLQLNDSGEEVYTKIKSGTMYGIIPSAGLRFYLGDRNSIDIAVEYHQYLSKPQSYIGGFAFVPRFSFVF